MKVLTWNVLYSEDIDAIASQLESIDFDIACLQEVVCGDQGSPWPDMPTILNERLGLTSFFAVAADVPSKQFSFGNLVLSKWPINSGLHFELRPSESETVFSLQGRCLACTKIDVDGREISVASAHLSYSPGFQGEAERTLELQNLETYLQQNSTLSILAGDFNAGPDSKTIQLTESYLVNCGPDADNLTWTTKPFDDGGGFATSELNWRLDYVFCSSDISVLKAEVVETNVSDHLPVLVELAL